MRVKIRMEKGMEKSYFQPSILLQFVIQENKHVDFFRVEVSS